MSFVNKEELPKIAKLGAACVAVFGCAAWRVAGASSPSKPAPTADQLVAAIPEPTPVKEEKKVEDGEIEVPMLFVAATSNPFRFIDSPSGTAPVPIGSMPALPLPSGPLTMDSVPPLEASAPAPLPMRVSGIVSGPNATAVVEIGEETRVVRKGTMLPDGSLVVKIGTMDVVLRRGGKKIVLDVRDS